MTQPTSYQPTSDFEAELGTSHGAHLNTEFQNIRQSIAETLENLAKIQRDDTLLANQSVHPDTLTTATKALIAADWVPIGIWQTATVYAAGNLVEDDGKSYVCTTNHVSGTFATDKAAGKWVTIYQPLSAAGITASGVAFAPTGTIAATDVQAAVAEVSSESLQKSSNLGDLPSPSVALTNIGGMAAAGGTYSGPVNETMSNDIAAGATVDMSASTGNYVRITGSATITGFGSLAAGASRRVEFSGVCTLTHNLTSFILPGNANIVTAAGDSATFTSLGSGNWKCNAFQRQATLVPKTAYSNLDSDALPIVVGKNRVVNGSMMMNQRGATSVADDAYCLDRWYVLAETGSVTVAQQADQENGTPWNIRLTQPDGTAKRIGLAQIVESSNMRDIRGGYATLSARIRCSASSQVIRYAMLEHTGTADSVTSDVVNSWTNGTYTASNFFIAGLNVIAIGSVTPVSAVWTDINQINGAVSGSANNIIVFIWTEGTAAQSVTLDISNVQMEKGTVATQLEREPAPLTAIRCYRYYEKSFNSSVVPAQNVGVGTEFSFMAGKAGATAEFGQVMYLTKKRAAATITLYNPAAANAQVRDITAAVDCASSTTTASTENGFRITATGNASTSVGNILGVHWTADAEL